MSMENQQSQPSNVPTLAQSGTSQSNQLATFPQDDGQQSEASKALSRFASETPDYLTNLPEETEEQQLQVQLMLCDKTCDTKDLQGKTISVTGFTIEYGMLGTTDDGEVREGLRAKILTEGGDIVNTTSFGIIRAIRKMAQLYKKGPWMPPALLEIRGIKNGQRLVLVGIPRGRMVPKSTKKS